MNFKLISYVVHLDGKARNQLRTYKGLYIIKQTNHYKSVRDKDYLLDKVDWFVSSIIDTNLKQSGCI